MADVLKCRSLYEHKHPNNQGEDKRLDNPLELRGLRVRGETVIDPGHQKARKQVLENRYDVFGNFRHRDRVSVRLI